MKFLNIFARKDILVSSLLFLVSFIVYSSFSLPYDVGFHQSDLLISLSSQFGLLPSPGYPLFAAVTYLATWLLGPHLGIAFAAHIVSVLFTSLSVACLYLICVSLYDYASFPQRIPLFSPAIERVLLALGPSLLFAFSTLVWRYSLFAERYPFSLFLLSLGLLLCVKLITNPLNKPKLLLALSLTLGLGISHQWIFLGLTLGLLVILRDKLQHYSPSYLLLSLFLLLSATTLPFILLLPAAQNQLEYAYKLTPTLKGVYTFVLQDYLGDSQARTQPIQIFSNLDLKLVFHNIWQISKSSVQSLSWLSALILGASLLYQPLKKKHSFVTSFGGLTVLLILILSIVFDWTVNLEAYPEIFPQLIILQPLLVIIFWFGLYELVTRLHGAGRELLDQTKAATLVLGLLMALPIMVIYRHQSQVSLVNATVSSQVSQTILVQAEPGSLITCFSYSSCYSLIYNQQITGLNPEAIIVPFYYHPETIVFSHQLTHFPEYDSFPYLMYDIITWNIRTRPIYTVDLFDDYSDLLGIKYGFINYIPLGYFAQLSRGIPEQYAQSDFTLSDRLLASTTPDWDVVVQKSKLEMAMRHFLNTSIFFNSGLRGKAVSEVNIATNLGYELSPHMASKLTRFRAQLEAIQESEFYQLGFEVQPVDYILEQVDLLEENKAPGRAIEIARGAVTTDPTSLAARLRYAQLLETYGASDSAVSEYKNVLLLDDTNQTALERLSYQEELSK